MNAGVAAGTTFALLATAAFAQVTGPTLFEDNPCGIVQAVLNAIFGIAGAVALVLLVMGGIQYMTSGGDKVGVEAARGRITAAVVGLLIVFGSVLIINIVGGLVIENFEICKTPGS